MTLLETRKNNNLTQTKAANIIGIPVRTYRRYECDDFYGSEIKREAFISQLENACKITENKGLLTTKQIKEKLTLLFEAEYKDQISLCYLFGSYAKGKAKETSDVDLYISTTLSGLRFVGLIEKIRQTLHKNIDLIRDSELENNIELMKEILKYGVKIYEQ